MTPEFREVSTDGFLFKMYSDPPRIQSDERQEMQCSGPPMFLNSLVQFPGKVGIGLTEYFRQKEEFHGAISAFPYRDQEGQEVLEFKNSFTRRNGKPAEGNIWLIGNGPAQNQRILIPCQSILRVLDFISKN